MIKAHMALTSDDAALLLYVLVNSHYKWRKQPTISEKTGWTAEQVDAIARMLPEYIKRDVRADGIVIFTVLSPFREELQALVGQ